MEGRAAGGPPQGRQPGAAADVWDDIAGQDEAVRLLRSALARGRHHHAYLFIGPEGVGKTMTARAFARTLLCPEGAAGSLCGRCEGCARFEAGTHPDFLQVVPEGKTIGIGQVRALQRWAAMRPGLARRRVIVLEPAEAMTDVAQNALLKTLEEPPGQTVLILVSHGSEGIVPPLLSRCQRLRFRRLPVPQLKELIAARRPEYKEHVALIATLADGRPAVALERDWHDVLQRREELIRLVSRWPERDPVPALQLAASWDALPDGDVNVALDLLQYWLRDLLVVQEVPEAEQELLVNGDRYDALRQGAKRWPPQRLLEAQRACMVARRRLEQHVNKRLNFDVLLLRLALP